MLSKKWCRFCVRWLGLLMVFSVGFPAARAQSIHRKSHRGPEKWSTADTVQLTRWMAARSDLFGAILADSQHLEVQVLYTQIDRDKKGYPHFSSFTYHLDPRVYFYPASSIKLPLAALALEKLQRLKNRGIDQNTWLRIDSGSNGQSRVESDTSACNKKPSIGQYIRKMLLVSDNDAYNRLYEFIGPDEINRVLHQKGLSTARIIHRLEVGDSPASARWTNPFQFYTGTSVLYTQSQHHSVDSWPNPFVSLLKGKGYYTFHGGDSSLIPKPFDFSAKNGMSLADEQKILQMIIFPEAQPPGGRFNLQTENYTFLRRYMSMVPQESRCPSYALKDYPDNYCKFFLIGSDSAKALPEHIRIFNKIGQAYGFLIDNAYIVDFKYHIEFMLSAVINCNTDGIYNDDRYAYQTLGFPFMRHLGQLIYEKEKKRKKKYIPNLSPLKFSYLRRRIG